MSTAALMAARWQTSVGPVEEERARSIAVQNACKTVQLDGSASLLEYPDGSHVLVTAKKLSVWALTR